VLAVVAGEVLGHLQESIRGHERTVAPSV
jgi:hypothetical protein